VTCWAWAGRARDQFLASACFTLDEHGRVRRGNLRNGAQHLQQGRAVTRDFLEIVLAGDFLLRVDVLLFQSRLQRSDLFIRLHVFHRQRNLVRNFLKELCGGLRILIRCAAGNVESAVALSAHNKRDHAVGAHALLSQAPLIRILLLLLELPAKNGPLMMKHPPHTAFLRADLQARLPSFRR